MIRDHGGVLPLDQVAERHNDGLVPSPIELTITANRQDLKKTAYFLSGKQRSLAHVKGLAWAGGVFLAFFAEQWIVLGLCALVMLSNFITPSVRLWLHLRGVPEWAYAPVSFSLDDSGVFVMTPQHGRQLSWQAVSKVTLTDDDWIFAAAGQPPVVLHRRQLSKDDEAAIRAMAEHHQR
ncbi:YcxB family protein [Catelliglobosispora koreensis]|uniref:YcxB family protein n=1 Tax=Catelliglobosispora koreensis TaxID=129052 RepID=UPI000366E0AB|nr:YcxB family protein [Catelliglobosispora koreensis]